MVDVSGTRVSIAELASTAVRLIFVSAPRTFSDLVVLMKWTLVLRECVGMEQIVKTTPSATNAHVPKDSSVRNFVSLSVCLSVCLPVSGVC